MTLPNTDTFDEAWAEAETIPGWLTRDQAALLWEEARRLAPGSTVVEIGSHRGRSTVVLGKAIRSGGRVVAVDPFVEGRLFGGPSTRDEFEANIRNADLGDVVELRPQYSTRLRPLWGAQIDLLYIDGKHDYWTFSDDLRWLSHLPTGGSILVHDTFSSIGVTLGILRHVLPGTQLDYVRRVGSMALFRRETPDAESRKRILSEMPWWLRNVGIKVLLRLHLRAVAEAMGHDGPHDPY